MLCMYIAAHEQVAMFPIMLYHNQIMLHCKSIYSIQLLTVANSNKFIIIHNRIMNFTLVIKEGFDFNFATVTVTP